MSNSRVLGEKDIETPEKRGNYVIAVIGCAQTSLSQACLFAEAGFKVVTVDVNQNWQNLSSIGKGRFPKLRVNTLVKKHLEEGNITIIKKTRNAASTSDIIVFNIPISVEKKNKLDYSLIEKACREVGRGLRAGTMIIFVSAISPGITEILVRESLERASGLNAGVEFGLAFSPYPSPPDYVINHVASYPRIVGAINKHSLEIACLVLSIIQKEKKVKCIN